MITAAFLFLATQNVALPETPLAPVCVPVERGAGDAIKTWCMAEAPLRMERPYPPETALSQQIPSGWAEVRCVFKDARMLENCQVVSESHPVGFGRVTLRALRTAEVAVVEGEDSPRAGDFYVVISKFRILGPTAAPLATPSK
ncbi:hypothetical protein [Brevundimonas sp. Marseille-Q4549]